MRSRTHRSGATPAPTRADTRETCQHRNGSLSELGKNATFTLAALSIAGRQLLARCPTSLPGLAFSLSSPIKLIATHGLGRELDVLSARRSPVSMRALAKS
jgi:hypothetical protein